MTRISKLQVDEFTTLTTSQQIPLESVESQSLSCRALDARDGHPRHQVYAHHLPRHAHHPDRGDRSWGVLQVLPGEALPVGCLVKSCLGFPDDDRPVGESPNRGFVMAPAGLDRNQGDGHRHLDCHRSFALGRVSYDHPARQLTDVRLWVVPKLEVRLVDCPGLGRHCD